MGALLRLIAARHLWLAKGRTLLTLLGVCIGVAAVVGITALNGAVLDAFNSMVDTISRGSALQVSGGEAGLPDSVLEKVRAVPGVANASPLLENTVADPDTGDRILVLGIDFLGPDPFRGLAEKEGGKNIVDDEMAFLNTPNAVLIAGPYAQARKLQKGQKLRLITPSGPQEFTVYGLLAPTGAAKAFGGSVGIMAMDAAQEVFGRVGRYDRIDVEAVGTEPVGQVRLRILEATGGGLTVDRPQDRGKKVGQMVFALQTGLQLTSGVALLVGMFVVFNTMAMAIMQRRRELATLRALGMGRVKVTLLVAGEAALLGVLGGLLGIVLGEVLARAALQTVADAMAVLWVEVKPKGVDISPTLAATGFVMGLVTAVVGAAKPAWEAAGISPVMVLAGRAHSAKAPRNPAVLAAAGLALFGLGFPVSTLPAVKGAPVFGFVASFMVLAGVALMGPATLTLLKMVAEPAARSVSSVTAQLAAGNLVRDLGRASVTAAALMLGMSLSIGVGAMVGAFKSTMDTWLINSVPADMFISAGTALADQKTIPLKAELGEDALKLPEVAEMFRVRQVNLPYQDLNLTVLSLETEPYLKRAKLMVREGPDPVVGDVLRRTGAVTISENLSHKKNLHPGDVLRLGTPKGMRDFPIVAVAVDFTSDQGFAMMDRETYLDAFGDPLVDMFQVYLKPGVDLEQARQHLTATVGKTHGLTITTNVQFRGYVAGLVDNAFRITNAIQLVAVLIALLGIVNTLLAAVLDRTREIGVLRAVGGTRGQVNRIMVVEAILLGLGAALMATVGGSGFGYIFTGVINFQSTGWSLPFTFPVRTVIEAFFLSIVVAAVAAIIPARRAGQLDIRDALGVE
jgi:putative ABC transport system permease protein